MTSPPHHSGRFRASSPGSRPRSSRHTTTSSMPIVSQPEDLILPDGPVSAEATELLDQFAHISHPTDTTLADSDESARTDNYRLPWWRTPSPWWLIVMLPFTAIATGATIAPRLEIYTLLACSIHKPEIFQATTSGGIASLLGNAASGLEALAQYGPDRSQLCAKDPTVQAAVAQLNAVLTATMGVLSCLTTAWWGSFSDRYGRTRIMFLSISGLLLNECNFILVALAYSYLPGGYWFLLVGPMLEGSLGGFASSVGAMHAYVADTTTPQTRSGMFSMALGLMFTGMAIGPAFGSLILKVTQHTLSVFYFAAFTHAIYAILVWAVVPESISKQQMLDFRDQYAKEGEQEARLQAAERGSGRAFSISHSVVLYARRIFRFLSPLAIFLPNSLEKSNGLSSSPKRDWNLALVAISYGFTVSIIGSYLYKFQYAASAFGWTPEIIGYWISLVGAARAIFLALILPVIIKLFKPKVHSPPEPEAEPLLRRDSSTRRSRSREPHTLRELHSASFDLWLARISMLIEILVYIGMALTASPLIFTIFGMLGSFGAGFSPAVQSAAIEIYSRRGGREVGKLYGALSVVQALCSQIMGPAVFGFVYMRTVATYPRAIFFTSSAVVGLSFVALALVKIPKGVHLDEEDGDMPFGDPHVLREDTLISGDRGDVEDSIPKAKIVSSSP